MRSCCKRIAIPTSQCALASEYCDAGRSSIGVSSGARGAPGAEMAMCSNSAPVVSRRASHPLAFGSAGHRRKYFSRRLRRRAPPRYSARHLFSRPTAHPGPEIVLSKRGKHCFQSLWKHALARRCAAPHSQRASRKMCLLCSSAAATSLSLSARAGSSNCRQYALPRPAGRPAEAARRCVWEKQLVRAMEEVRKEIKRGRKCRLGWSRCAKERVDLLLEAAVVAALRAPRRAYSDAGFDA